MQHRPERGFPTRESPKRIERTIRIALLTLDRDRIYPLRPLFSHLQRRYLNYNLEPLIFELRACKACGIRNSAKLVTTSSKLPGSAETSLIKAFHCRCFCSSLANAGVSASGKSTGTAVSRRANVAAIAR